MLRSSSLPSSAWAKRKISSSAPVAPFGAHDGEEGLCVSVDGVAHVFVPRGVGSTGSAGELADVVVDQGGLCGGVAGLLANHGVGGDTSLFGNGGPEVGECLITLGLDLDA